MLLEHHENKLQEWKQMQPALYMRVCMWTMFRNMKHIFCPTISSIPSQAMICMFGDEDGPSRSNKVLGAATSFRYLLTSSNCWPRCLESTDRLLQHEMLLKAMTKEMLQMVQPLLVVSLIRSNGIQLSFLL